MEIFLALLAFFGQVTVLFLTGRMISFAKNYGKPWANAFKVFFVCMAICLLRRMGILAITLGLDGDFKELIIWYDRYVSNPILTGLYLIFLIMLVRWWKEFFEHLDELMCHMKTGYGQDSWTEYYKQKLGEK